MALFSGHAIGHPGSKLMITKEELEKLFNLEEINSAIDKNLSKNVE